MNRLINQPQAKRQRSKTVRASVPSSSLAQPFTLEQELEPFATWTSPNIWVPPKDASAEMGQTMLRQSLFCSSQVDRWEVIQRHHQSQFTQVREIELSKASIRLPKGRLFVSITEESDFHKIAERVPACVQTRLDEFLAGPGQQQGVRVYYLKPLCAEVDQQLIFTRREQIEEAIEKIQSEVFAYYRRHWITSSLAQFGILSFDAIAWLPRQIIRRFFEGKRREVEAYHAKLEFNRRKAAWRVARLHHKYRSDECSYEDVLALTKTPDRVDVIEQYAAEKELSRQEKQLLMFAAAQQLPWILTASISAALTAYCLQTALLAGASSVVMCDPIFVAEFPKNPGVLWKIGHFDEIAGVTHIEL